MENKNNNTKVTAKGSIIVEPFLTDDNIRQCKEIEVFCFNSDVKLVHKIQGGNTISIFDENLKNCDIKFFKDVVVIKDKVDELIKKAVELSKKISLGFKFVRVDWMVYNNKLQLEELTFTPYSGYSRIPDFEHNLLLGNFIN